LVESEPHQKLEYPPQDLNRLVEIFLPKIKNMPLLQKLGFAIHSSGYKAIDSCNKGEEPTIYYLSVLQKNLIKIEISIFSRFGGYFWVSIHRPGDIGKDGRFTEISIDRYFELYDNNSSDRDCMKLKTFSGTLEQKIDKALACLNKILEERFERVLNGSEWVDVAPSFFDYK